MNLTTLLQTELKSLQRKAAALEAAIVALRDADAAPAPAPGRKRGPKPGTKRGHKPGKVTKAVPPSGSLTVEEAKKYTGLHQTTLSKLKREKVITGEYGRYDRESLELYLESKKGDAKA